MSNHNRTPQTGTERKTNRLEAFSDAVLAIAITLPVVELHAPDIKPGVDLAAAYAALLPEYLSYALSCMVIGLYWVHSHFSGKIIRETDHFDNLLTVLFVALVSITPFPTRPFIEHFNDPVNSRVAASVYATLLAAPAVVYFLRWWYTVSHDLLDPRLAPEYLHRLTIKYAATAGVFVVGALLCWFVNWRLGIGLTFLITLGYLLPPVTPQYKPGQEPESEIEEADEQ